MPCTSITIGQIGCGYWGPNLLRNLNANPACDVKTVADTAVQRQAYIRDLYPTITVTSDADTVLNDAAIDAVVIATPAESHYPLVMRALERGKHVFVEKPMAQTVSQIDTIAVAADAAGRVAMVGHTFLYNAAVRYLKTLIDDGELGRIRYITSQRLNLGRIRSDVDALWNLAPHDISILQYLLDDATPVSVSRHGMDYVQDNIDDVVFLHLTYPDKILAHVHVSWLDPGKVRRMTIVGDRKMAVYDDLSDEKIRIFDKGIDRIATLGEYMDYDETSALTFDYRSGDILVPKINFEEPLKVEIQHFVDCIADGTPCLTGPAHAASVIRILCRADAGRGRD